MPGIYFHIPFCKSICSYCDFYKTTNTEKIETLVSMLQKEMDLQSTYLSTKKIETIYFGGGTPSLLSISQFNELLHACHSAFNIDTKVEITAEVNPDDLTSDYLKSLRKTGVNRLSIGIQSFVANDLKLMKRRHSSAQALNAVKLAQKAGFDNISVDLIYGIPGMKLKQWEENLNKVFELGIQHISAYHLSYHKNTKLWNDLKNGSIHEVLEEDSINQFSMLIDKAIENGFEHYEISNFAENGLYSQHNSSYWKQTEYLGLGPSAHSFNIASRQWNVSNIDKYIVSLQQNKVPAKIEKLSLSDQYNDYVITSLRTKWGLDRNFIQNTFGERYVEHLNRIIDKYSSSGKIIFENNTVNLTREGLFVSDAIMADFIILNTLI